MLARLVLPLIMLSLTALPALPQANLRPDPAPRLPQQPGQGLALKDQQFIVRAANLSDAEIEAGKLAASKAPAADVKAFGERVAADHQKLRKAIADLAQKANVKVESHASRPTWQAELQRLQGLSGADFEREFLNWQLQVHLSLADMYQTQASNSPDTELAKFAIVSLKTVQDRFDEAKRLGGRYGLAANTIKQPPQY